MSKHRCLFLLLTFSLAVEAFANGDPKYPFHQISEELRKDADAVVRENRTVYTIHQQNSATLHVFKVITIMNADAQNFAEEVLLYNKLTKIKRLDGTVYNAAGAQIKKLKKSEIYDQAAASGSTLFSDNRLKVINLSQGIYPYTVEIEYEVDYDYIYSIEGLTVVPRSNVAVQQSSYELIFPANLQPRYKTVNVSVEPVESQTPEGLEMLKWSFRDIAAVKSEPFAPMRTFFPEIMVAPSKFEYDGYVGDMSSWESYGRWISTLNAGRDHLSEPTKATIRELTKDLTSTEEKIKVLYEYMQNRTRYVNIALGIGGLQPFDASVVDQMGYGDCKALSNFMVTVLKEVGIKGYYATIMAGDNAPPVLLDFPSHQANHAIVAVPVAKDTIWLECTSQSAPMGYMGDFTGDRKAMLITENGGVMVNTMAYTAEDNKRTRVADVYLDKNGDATTTVSTIYKAREYEFNNLNFILNNKEQQKKWVDANVNIGAFEVQSFEMRETKAKIPSATVNLKLVLRNYATASGKRLFVTPNLMSKSSLIPEKVENRKTPVELTYPVSRYDTIRYHIPEEIYPESLPQPINIKTAFGEYEAGFTLDAGSLVYTRNFKMNKGIFPPERYPELIEFYKNIMKADNTKIVFLTKT